MYTSVTDAPRRRVLRHAAGELGAALFCGVFGMIYEHFSHEVYSYYMLYAFMFPLAAGLVLVLMALRSRLPARRFLNLFNSASATLALGSIAAGVVEIYGSTNRLLLVYQLAGGILLTASVFTYIFEKPKLKGSEAQLPPYGGPAQ